MPTSSDKLGLSKPLTTDPFDTATIAANWQIVDDHPGVFICTSGTRPTWGANQDGMFIFETDSGLAYRWDNGSGSFLRLNPTGHLVGSTETTPQTNATGVPYCDGCDDGMTLLYDHCKNHPQYVDVGQLVDYPRRACGQNPITQDPCIDDVKHLYDARTFIFQPTHDRCYLMGSLANSVDLYGMLMTDPAKTIKFVDDQPFPHTLPKNETPYFNHSDPEETGKN